MLVASLLATLAFTSTLGGDRPVDEELAEVAAAREIDPEDPELLARYADLLGRKKDVDGQLAYSMAALDALELAETDDAAAKESLQKRLLAKLLALDPAMPVLQGYRDTYLAELAWAMQLYAQNQKKHYNALEVCDRILGYRPNHTRARDTVRAILKSGDEDLRIQAERVLNKGELERPRAFVARWAAEHDKWSQAGVVTTDGYEVHSNIGYESLQIAAQSLEQIARFYRKFWKNADPRPQVGKTRVYLCKRRDEWVAIAKNPLTNDPGTHAFLWTEVMTRGGPEPETEIRFQLFGFDPRDVGRPLESLWPILWHEASHQYMALSTRGGLTVPPWLNEGMAQYFEGAFLGEGAEVFVGLPARERLDQLYAQLLADQHPLEETLAGDERISYMHYPTAWGVVYYLRHARGPNGDFPMRACLDRAVELANVEQGSARALFEAAVLQPLGQDFATFQERWEAWIIDLFEREAKPAECAAELTAAAEVHRAAGRDELALELFQDALLRAPNHAPALLGVARTHKLVADRSKGKDALAADRTLMWARRAHRAATSIAPNADVAAQALELAQSVDRTGFKRISEAEVTYRNKLDALIARQVEKGHPRAALAMAKRYLDDVLGDSRARDLALELREQNVLTLERPLRVFDGASLIGLSAFRGLFEVADGELVGRAERPERALLGVDRAFPGLFRLEGEFQLADPNTMCVFTVRQPRTNAMVGFAWRPASDPKVATPRTDYMPFSDLDHGEVRVAREVFLAARQTRDFGFDAAIKVATPPKAGAWVRFRLLREHAGKLAFELDGKRITEVELPSSDDAAELGFVLFGGRGRLRGLHAIELDRL